MATEGYFTLVSGAMGGLLRELVGLGPASVMMYKVFAQARRTRPLHLDRLGATT